MGSKHGNLTKADIKTARRTFQEAARAARARLKGPRAYAVTDEEGQP